MNDIKDILICPVCKSKLTNDLFCKQCSDYYSYKYGVFDIVSQKLSKDQQILWRITDEMIEDEVKAKKQESIESNWDKDYYSRKNKETKEAEDKLNDYMDKLIENLSGVVCDLATGMGGMLQKLLNSNKKDFYIVCTDLDKRILAWTRKIKQTDDNRVFYIATDGRYMSIEDQTFDYITSRAAFGNIPESNKVATELYRILKPEGKLIIQGSYIEKDSKSYEVAKGLGIERGVVEDSLIKDLQNAGFENVISTVIAEAIWSENPYDLIPVAGDTQRYCIIQAQRTKGS